MKITSLDHLVLTVYDLDKTCEFYARVLGMEVIDFDNKLVPDFQYYWCAVDLEIGDFYSCP